ncbi:hypothetical protein GCM10010182_21050 [Actinomadura cremea]|nr:hypothetical protein GCM10010182_21050 [Actinomadura cremea]
MVIDCTDTGASPPTGTFPTMICRDLRRGVAADPASCPSRTVGIPSETLIPLLCFASARPETLSAPRREGSGAPHVTRPPGPYKPRRLGRMR